ncbi:hypothetical protein GNI_004770 [Gregarina niphandrodes]|uniref:Transmembrane protein n=1 Tax=Gregarina niphandrodes TaxID=110365 RepID=A0A023BDE1_GRENI|nr:hypothetical protein GNI_004770 [Gregarina niphandrodes]EZG88397.1 hypothetical protein GNI_004770 [Gregarina niphandrodes]|eukprot:XP_011128571.1 hypothetical protein GNI_004770 [Gregarina niphandrodes]
MNLSAAPALLAWLVSCTCVSEVLFPSVQIYVEDHAGDTMDYFMHQLVQTGTLINAATQSGPLMMEPEPPLEQSPPYPSLSVPVMYTTLQHAAASNVTYALLLHSNVGLGYACLWPTDLQALVQQANILLPQWQYVLLHWHPRDRTILPSQIPGRSDLYSRWWLSTEYRVNKFSALTRQRLHRRWHRWPPTAVQLLKLVDSTIHDSMAILFSPLGIKELSKKIAPRAKGLGAMLPGHSATTGYSPSGDRDSMARKLSPKGLVTTPIFLGPREVGESGFGGEFITQWLLETREAVSSGADAALSPGLEFVRRTNVVRFRTPETEKAVWAEYEIRRYRNQKTVLSVPTFLQEEYRRPVEDVLS